MKSWMDFSIELELLAGGGPLRELLGVGGGASIPPREMMHQVGLRAPCMEAGCLRNSISFFIFLPSHRIR